MKNTHKQVKAASPFYKEAMHHLNSTGQRFMIGGGFAFHIHTGIFRDTKDLDIFCTVKDYPEVLRGLADKGYETEVRDNRWLAKAYKDQFFIDIIFSSPNGLCVVEDSWFDTAVKGEIQGEEALFIGAEDLIWCKIYVQNRERYDGADVNHLILRKGKELDWKLLYKKMEYHWSLLLGQLFNFLFVYPGRHDCIPKWLMDELLQRAKAELSLSPGFENICRGSLLCHTHYEPDILDWDFKSI
jgi:hypothetical protein